MKSIKEVLQERDNLSEQEAEALMQEARDQMHQHLQEGNIPAAYNICEAYFGLEPDYLIELI